MRDEHLAAVDDDDADEEPEDGLEEPVVGGGGDEEARERGGEHDTSGEAEHAVKLAFGGVPPDQDEERAEGVESGDDDAPEETHDDGVTPGESQEPLDEHYRTRNTGSE